MKQIIQHYYNGYRFSPASELVYNPMMTLYLLEKLIHSGKLPDDFTDSNIRVDYNQIAFLFGNNFKKRDEVIETLSRDKAIQFSSKINITFDMRDYKEGRHIVEGLLFSGILTYSDKRFLLKIPNLVTYERALSYFERIKDFEIEKKDYSKWMVEYLTTGNVEFLVQGFFTEVVQQFPGDFFANVNESFYHGLLFHLIYNNTPKDLYEVLPEYNLPNGQANLIVYSYPKSSGAKGHGRVPSPKATASGERLSDAPYRLHDLFEIKRVPKSATDKELNAMFDQGKQQLQSYLKGEYKTWRGVVVCFRGNKDYRIEIL
ncbi:MAG: hypothetical protein HY738_06235 [Bacteroidia bacterium]|nr:hypothetical protein [Bacteroidia bacterium]